MVADPRITTAQAAVVLRVSPARVRHLLARGELVAQGRKHRERRLLLSDVERLAGLGEPITVRVAAQILGCTMANVRALLAAGQLTERPRSDRRLYRVEVQALAASGAVTWLTRRPGPVGCVSTSAAARILGVSVATARRRAAVGLVPSVRDERGYYWFRPEHLEMVARAQRDSEQAAVSFNPSASGSAAGTSLQGPCPLTLPL